MAKRMLIDATHAEETRVVVLDGNRLEDYDVETAAKQHLKGNIYLAKVVRVEPSLQAAFVEYGGGRHGFLAFGEIHPDYYQIPVADRQRLIEMQAEDARREEEEEDRAAAAEEAGGRPPVPQPEPDAPEPDLPEPDVPEPEMAGPDSIEPPSMESEAVASDAEGPPAAPVSDAPAPPAVVDAAQEPAVTPIVEAIDQFPEPLATRALPLAMEVDRVSAPLPERGDMPPADMPHDNKTDQPDIGRPEFFASDSMSDRDAGVIEVIEDSQNQPPPETMGGDQADDSSEDGGEEGGEERSERRIPPRFLRNYKIQEVIKRRQILLVQVVKEERGTKGAALTTYISLAGRYSVLMPNSPRGGGISRKITSAADRRRLKEVTAELDLPKGMGLIVRTAGANRPKPEITRDCEYLLRLWDDIRDHTMRSTAPALIYEEASLIKRVIRDVYSRDVDEVLVDGADAWRAARDYMRMLMPSHAKKVILWSEQGQSLFGRQGVEAQLDAMLSPTVQLKSGGYLVINQAEALVAIDVNSGRSTRERNIEETALRTNLEAADEVARQLRLRDLAGLIVIDFIDMDQRRHNVMVERRIKEALKNDRARIQLGTISHFGLLEMSRQRLRPSLAETSFVSCPHCNGTGHVRGTEGAALHVLRQVEEEGAKRRSAEIIVHVAGAIAMYILNHKRARLAEIEARFGMHVSFAADESLIAPGIRIDRVRAQVASEVPAPVAPPPVMARDDDDSAEEEDGARGFADTAEETVSLRAELPDPEPARAHGDAEEAARPGESAKDAEQRRRRRRRRGGRRDEVSSGAAVEPLIAVGAVPDDGLEAALTEHIEGVPEYLDSRVTPVTVAESSEVQADAPTMSADETDAESSNRRRGRRGGRRRRRDDDPVLAAIREPGAEQPDLPAYTGPTPADPFGGHNFDIFDALERAEQAAAAEVIVTSSPAEQVPAEPEPDQVIAPFGVEQQAPAADPIAEPEPMAAAEPADPTINPDVVPNQPPAERMPESTTTPAQGVMHNIMNDAAAEAAPPVVHDVTPEPPAPVVRPIMVGVDEPPAEKKRGWWRR